MKKFMYLLPAIVIFLPSCNTINQTMDALEQNRQAVEMSTQAINENVEAVEAANRSIEENRRQLDAINATLKKAGES